MMTGWAGFQRATRIGAAVILALWLGAAGPARAIDCDWADDQCLDASRLPGGVGWSELVRRGHRFFGIDTKVYIVGHADVRARIPYMQRALPPLKAQVHIPEVYHARVESDHAGQEHYIWHYIVSHEFAHVYQDSIGFIDALRLASPGQSHQMFELHADFLAGFFIGREYSLPLPVLDQLLNELNTLPAGDVTAVDFHGSTRQRYFVATQGALLGRSRPNMTLSQATAEGLNVVWDLVLPSNK
ncbi:MAG: hypothetical protein KTR21_16815 [Rhodobacteraceae bacterium]|nr:hypothetical protein [Paracoccaceae bacterium]